MVKNPLKKNTLLSLGPDHLREGPSHRDNVNANFALVLSKMSFKSWAAVWHIMFSTISMDQESNRWSPYIWPQVAYVSTCPEG